VEKVPRYSVGVLRFAPEQVEFQDLARGKADDQLGTGLNRAE
jgi:hypothetical protein